VTKAASKKNTRQLHTESRQIHMKYESMRVVMGSSAIRAFVVAIRK
jgi:hypothetical protein